VSEACSVVCVICAVACVASLFAVSSALGWRQRQMRRHLEELDRINKS
jgi:hypothetical protein